MKELDVSAKHYVNVCDLDITEMVREMEKASLM
jgi:hypothetical protein